MHYLLSDIATIVKGKLIGRAQAINHVFIDSRQNFDPQSLFVALKGLRRDGDTYINDLYTRGLRCFMVNPHFDISAYPNADFIVVNNTLTALQDLARHHRLQFNYPVIAITGSNGKTLVKEWLCQLLHSKVRTVRNPKSYNSQVGVPLSVLLMHDEADIALFEAGISEPKEMQKLAHIIHAKFGIITNIGQAHQENFDSLAHKLSEKLLLFTDVDTLVYDADAALINATIQQQLPHIKTFTWGTNTQADLRIIQISKTDKKSILTLNYQNVTVDMDLFFTDNASIENAMHCIAMLLVLGWNIEAIGLQISKLTPVAMRLELKTGINGSTIINDTYNADINSLSIALDFITGLTQHPTKVLILSDIFQSELNHNSLYQRVSHLIDKAGIQQFIGIGPELCKHQHLFHQESVFFKTTNEFISRYKTSNFQNKAILIKGSRVFEFERIAQLLEHKVHQTHLEVNLNALVNNLNYFKSLLKKTTRIMAVVKAGSYGLGTHEIASLLQYQQVDYLAVAYADEGVLLRQAGIRLPIVVLNPEPDSYQTMISNQLEPEIYNLSALNSLLSAAQAMGESNYPIHIKLDTGMHRLGFDLHQLTELCNLLNKQTHAKVISVFSHLAAADEEQHKQFTLDQIQLFKEMCVIMDQQLPYTTLKHLLNSSGIAHFASAQLDMVRLGIGLYGIADNIAHQAYLQNTACLSSAIVQIKWVSKDQTVGYGRHGKLESDKRIAIIPIGYADGLDRRLSCGVYSFWIKGKLAPIIGNICMDTCMIDVSEIEVQEGDRVEIIGPHLSVQRMADLLNTIPYEILTSISQRVKRIYYYD